MKRIMKKNKIDFKEKIVLSAIIIASIPLILSYIIFIGDKLSSIDSRIRTNLKDFAQLIAEDENIQEKLYYRENDGSIQAYTKDFIERFQDIDIIVIADMTGKKYSHLDEKQIGEIFINEDKSLVLAEGKSYYSLMEGSQGTTLRWFQPIMYNGQQVGFIMIGKFNSTIVEVNKKTSVKFMLLFAATLSISIIGANIFASSIKKAILNMEPEEIATLYNQKKSIINSVKDGIIAINKDNEITEVNNICYELFSDFSVDKVIKKLKPYIENNEEFEMKEFIIEGKKIFITSNPMFQKQQYLGVVITLSDRNDINKIAKEITGIDEVIKNLRVNVHEFKNSLHVILGLLQLKEYDEAKKYVSKLQEIQINKVNKFSMVEDYYVNALLLSRESVAKERRVNLILTNDSYLYTEHNYIDSQDIVTILGNLIENALEACSLGDKDEKIVEVDLFEDENIIKIEVFDNGVKIDETIKDIIFKQGVSSKGEDRGTGLYLVKNRVELYSGTIEIDDRKDGKKFIIKILKGE